MRNRYPGTCYRCGARVEPGDGHFEKYKGGWRTQHAACAIKFRGSRRHYIYAPDAPEVPDEDQAIGAGVAR